jgi:hypothetical protein
LTRVLVNGVATDLATRQNSDGNRVVSVGKRDVNVEIETCNSMDGLVYVSETPNGLIISHFERDLALKRRELGLSIIDETAVHLRSRLGQAPLVPTILQDSAVLPPMSRSSFGGGVIKKLLGRHHFDSNGEFD